MAFLRRQLKSVLLELADEFDTQVSENRKVSEIINAITTASDYEEEAAKAYLDRILEVREREEQEKIRESERQERERERQFELEKLRMQAMSETSSTASSGHETERKSKRVNLRDWVPRFDQKQIDITLFFMLFEKQAVRHKIDTEDWVSQLIMLLPTDMAEIVIREQGEEANDFQHIKQLLFKRFKLSARALRIKFESHDKKSEDLWSDLVYELRGYLNNWLETLEIQDFDALKELMLAEQLKKRVPLEIKEHFIDSWEDLNRASEIAEKCDKFESVRRENRKFERKSTLRDSFLQIAT